MYWHDKTPMSLQQRYANLCYKCHRTEIDTAYLVFLLSGNFQIFSAGKKDSQIWTRVDHYLDLVFLRPLMSDV